MNSFEAIRLDAIVAVFCFRHRTEALPLDDLELLEVLCHALDGTNNTLTDVFAHLWHRFLQHDDLAGLDLRLHVEMEAVGLFYAQVGVSGIQLTDIVQFHVFVFNRCCVVLATLKARMQADGIVRTLTCDVDGFSVPVSEIGHDDEYVAFECVRVHAFNGHEVSVIVCVDLRITN